jgi:hypothetical protein
MLPFKKYKANSLFNPGTILTSTVKQIRVQLFFSLLFFFFFEFVDEQVLGVGQ